MAVLGLFYLSREAPCPGYGLVCMVCPADSPRSWRPIGDGREVAFTLLHVMVLDHMREHHPDLSTLAAEVLG